MSVKLAKNGTWLAQFRCKDKFGKIGRAHV